MKRLNNKGFTIAEVLVSFSLITVILASMVSATIFYRDKLKNEEVVSQLYDFKNTITKVIYDDITRGEIVRLERCISTANCINFVDRAGNSRTLKVIEVDRTTSTKKRGVYLYYNGLEYLLPDSDLGTGYDRVCDFVGGFELYEYQSKLYKVKTAFKHKGLDLQMDLLFIIT